MAGDRTLRRVLLYGTAALVLVALAILWTRRRAQDREDHLGVLRARLGVMDIVLMTDPQGKVVEADLDKDFADPHLPADIRSEVLRVRAWIAVKRGQTAEAERRLDEAKALAGQATTSDGAIRIERALVRAMAKDDQGALSLLEGWTPSDPVLFLWRAIAVASSRESQGDHALAVKGLDDALSSLPAPLPSEPAVFLRARSWTPPEAARAATRSLVLLQGGDEKSPAWDRLRRLAPGMPGPNRAQSPASASSSAGSKAGLKPAGPGGR